MAARFGGEGSEPNDEDGLFERQEMPTADGEMAEEEKGAAGDPGGFAEEADRAGMRGQLDDSMNALGEGEDASKARKGIPQDR